jgi:DNA-binding SARP family transcriptional activator
MSELKLNFLGDLEVIRDGKVMALPPSKKTRALLAYLAVNQRAFRREQLCELFWEIPDDPRGSLRWSLSKLRRLVDDEDARRIVADRTNVTFEPHGIEIDVTALNQLVKAGLDNVSTDRLEYAATHWDGHFLEGLELSNFHGFYAWCIAEREQSGRDQAILLRTLIDRHEQNPDQALVHARSLVGLFPYDEEARARLVSLLIRIGHKNEAEQQVILGNRMLEEAAAQPTGLLRSALQTAVSEPPSAATGSVCATPQPAQPPAQGSATQHSSRAETTLFGRVNELEQLESSLTRTVNEAQACIFMIRGDPGIGKSTLTRSLRHLALDRGAFLLEAEAIESEVIRPFALWVDSFRRLNREDVPSLFGSEQRMERDQLFGALSDLIAERSRDQPVVVIFDDLHWCDESSISALHYVARMNRHRPFYALVAGREAELRDNGSVQKALRGLRHDGLLSEVTLGPLDTDALRSLISSHSPEADSDRLSRESGGNPLLAIELARAHATDDHRSISELVAERLAAFDLRATEALQWAAVLSPRLNLRTLERASGLDRADLEDALDMAERHGMLRHDAGAYSFSHDLIARGVYTDISPARRRVMHLRVAEILEADTALDLQLAADLAHHASQSNDPALTTRAMISAGRLSLRFYANDEAVSLARRGLQFAETLSSVEQVPLTLELKEIMLSAAPLEDWEAAAEEYVELAELALDHGHLAHARLGYHMAGTVRWMHGNWTGARDESLQAERITRGGSEEDHVIGMADAAKCLALLEQDLPEADAMLMEAKSLATRSRISTAAIPTANGMLRFHENRLDEAEESFKEARTLCKTAGDRLNEFQVNEYLTMIEIERGDFASAARRCEELVTIGNKLREGSESPFSHAMVSLCDYALNDDDTNLDEHLESLRVADAKHRLAYVLNRAALIEVDRGRTDKAVQRAEEALSHAQILDRSTEVLLAHVALARAHARAERIQQMKRHVAALAQMDHASVAAWARSQAQPLLGQTD